MTAEISPPGTTTRHLSRIPFLFLAGAVTAMIVAWVFAWWVEPRAGNCQAAESAAGKGHWSIYRWTQAGSVAIESDYEPDRSRSWGTEQLLGPPDTPGSGDIPTAWASSSQDGQQEWLILDYDKAVEPAFVHVVETYNPGALIKLSVFKPTGEEVNAWEGDDPTPLGSDRGVSKVPIKVDFATRRVKLYLDSPAVRGWNEIDAVGLVDRQGGVQWAIAAQASSTYASGRGTVSSAGVPEALIPRWSSISRPADGASKTPAEARTSFSAGFGWPFVAMCYESDSPPVVANPYMRSGFVVYTTAAATTTSSHQLPYRPILSGLMLDAVIYGLALWLFYRVPLRLMSRPLRIGRELMRLRRGQCLNCGYDLRYDFARGCLECGWHREKAETLPPSRTHYGDTEDEENAGN